VSCAYGGRYGPPNGGRKCVQCRHDSQYGPGMDGNRNHVGMIMPTHVTALRFFF